MFIKMLLLLLPLLLSFLREGGCAPFGVGAAGSGALRCHPGGVGTQRCPPPPPPPWGCGVGVRQPRPTEPPGLVACVSSWQTPGLADGSHEEGTKSEPMGGFWGPCGCRGGGHMGTPPSPSRLQPRAQVALGQRNAQHDAAAQQEAHVLHHKATPRAPAGTPQHLGELGQSGGSAGAQHGPLPPALPALTMSARAT